MAPLGIALIGCGGMGKNLIKGAHDTGLGKLVVACDQDEERARAAAEELGSEWSLYMDDVIGRGDVDVIVVATPNFAHCECVIKAAATGKPIFCEKPMALSTAECDRMIEACKASGSPLMIGQVLRFLGNCKKAIELVREGAVGEPFAMHVARMNLSDPAKQAPWRREIGLSGGTLFEFGVHEIDFMRCICGDAKSVFASGDNFLHKDTLDYPDHIFLNIQFQNGAVGLYANGAASITPWNENRIWGTEGALVFGHWGGPMKLQRRGEEPQSLEVKGGGHVAEEMRLFLTAVRDGSPMPIPGEEGRASVAIAEAALESIRTGQTVEL